MHTYTHTHIHICTHAHTGTTPGTYHREAKGRVGLVLHRHRQQALVAEVEVPRRRWPQLHRQAKAACRGKALLTEGRLHAEGRLHTEGRLHAEAGATPTTVTTTNTNTAIETKTFKSNMEENRRVATVTGSFIVSEDSPSPKHPSVAARALTTQRGADDGLYNAV
jgi:hypothetical protein